MTDELLAQMDHARQRAYEDGAAAGYAEGQPERAELAATVAELSAERDALLDELCKLGRSADDERHDRDEA